MPESLQLAEIDAALLQAAVAVGLTGIALVLYRRYRKPWFAWFGAAFALYVVRLAIIIAFVVTEHRAWLYWHQVTTGWTAIALLWAAMLFSRPRPFRPAYGAVLLFPVLWSYVAIYLLDSFLWAALPAVGFLSLVTLWSGVVFVAHWRRTRVPSAAFLGGALVLWALHHLDYPFLRARGAWVPWGYYLDIAFLLLVGTGLVFLVLDDLRGGLRAMTALVEPGAMRGPASDVGNLLRRAATLPAATGAAIFSAEPTGRAMEAIGACAGWATGDLPPALTGLVRDVLASDRPVVRGGGSASGTRSIVYEAGLPIPRATGGNQVLVVVGEARHPFTALDDEFLVALGRQIGSALDTAELNEQLSQRTEELSRLSVRMIQQHEEERRRLSLELHDETAQVFSAVKLQLGVLGERASGEAAQGLANAMRLVDQGMRSIRSVTEMLRPAVLDDLGLAAALRSLAAEFSQSTGIEVVLETDGDSSGLPDDVELVLFRAMQESLSNVARHAGARRVRASLRVSPTRASLVVDDDGRGGTAVRDVDGLQRAGHAGLAGMRERVASLGGRLALGPADGTGLRVAVDIPLHAGGEST